MSHSSPFAGSQEVDKSNNVHAATSASVSCTFLEFDLAIRAYIAVMLHVMPDLMAIMVGTAKGCYLPDIGSVGGGEGMTMRGEFSRYYFAIRDRIKTQQSTACKHSQDRSHSRLDLRDPIASSVSPLPGWFRGEDAPPTTSHVDVVRCECRNHPFNV